MPALLIEKDIDTKLPLHLRKARDYAAPYINGRLTVVLWDGRQIVLQNGEPGFVSQIEVKDPRLFRRLFSEGWVGFTEAYLEGWWETDDLLAFMDHMHTIDYRAYDAFEGGVFSRITNALKHWLQSNTKKQAKKNISYHYDLGNEFYGLWLDDTMTYSSALFETGQESTEAAQIKKYASMVDQMGAKEGDHVLEIGCGWGGFAEYAAKERGLKVTGLTISQEQHDYAVERIAKAGLSDKVEIKLQDYRDEKGTYDGIASIEMFEAVGEKYWPTYFNSIRDCLKPGANATLQIITVEEKRWEVYRKSVDFIQKYIFPGGMLPSPMALRNAIENAGLQVSHSIEFGESYSQTLRRWYADFNDRWDDVAALGFDDRFRRMWNLYLTSCASTFHSGNCDVTQITVTNPA